VPGAILVIARAKGSTPMGYRLQYNDICGHLVKQPFFRGAPYSFGDAYIDEKAQLAGKGVTPSSILKPTINAHIAFMWKDYSA
jgi:hypothetical protein